MTTVNTEDYLRNGTTPIQETPSPESINQTQLSTLFQEHLFKDFPETWNGEVPPYKGQYSKIHPFKDKMITTITNDTKPKEFKNKHSKQLWYTIHIKSMISKLKQLKFGDAACNLVIDTDYILLTHYKEGHNQLPKTFPNTAVALIKKRFNPLGKGTVESTESIKSIINIFKCKFAAYHMGQETTFKSDNSYIRKFEVITDWVVALANKNDGIQYFQEELSLLLDIREILQVHQDTKKGIKLPTNFPDSAVSLIQKTTKDTEKALKEVTEKSLKAKTPSSKKPKKLKSTAKTKEPEKPSRNLKPFIAFGGVLTVALCTLAFFAFRKPKRDNSK